jgi:hypothetical protein
MARTLKEYANPAIKFEDNRRSALTTAVFSGDRFPTITPVHTCALHLPDRTDVCTVSARSHYLGAAPWPFEIDFKAPPDRADVLPVHTYAQNHFRSGSASAHVCTRHLRPSRRLCCAPACLQAARGDRSVPAERRIDEDLPLLRLKRLGLGAHDRGQLIACARGAAGRSR